MDRAILVVGTNRKAESRMIPASRSPHAAFEELWHVADGIPGWLTRDQGRLLFDRAAQVAPGGTIVEIGSHQGRSTVVLAGAAAAHGSSVVAVDPFVEGRLFGGQPTRAKLVRNLERCGLLSRVELIEEYSTRLRPSWQRTIDLLYIDGKHDYWTVTDDLRWADHLVPGGCVIVHDAFSSIGVTLGILLRVLPGRTLRYRGRVGSLASFATAPPAFADRLRIVAELPWWLRNVVIKVLLRLRLRGAARLLGHDSPYDPY
jgi:predicted O-methyltransferase YrrM